jgi:Trypsin
VINKGESMNFKKLYLHPKYKVGEQFDDFDMAILKFREPIQLFWHIRTICVPKRSKLFPF